MERKYLVGIIILVVLLVLILSYEDCESYCSRQPQVQCIGRANTTGLFAPFCSCEFRCGVVDEQISMPNPAAAYCEEQGGTYETRNDPREEGGQYGICILENGTICDEWAYYEGGCESCLTYCEKQPHIMCTGHLEVSGEYPECECEWVCDESGPV